MIELLKERGAILFVIPLIIVLAGCSSLNSRPAPAQNSALLTHVAKPDAKRLREPSPEEKFPSLRLFREQTHAIPTAMAAREKPASEKLDEKVSFWDADPRFARALEKADLPRNSILRDLFSEVGHMAWRDLDQFKTKKFLFTLGMGAALAGGARTLDHDIADHLDDRHMISGWETVGDFAGHPTMHVVVAGSMYLYARIRGNRAGMEKSLILLEGLTLTHVSTAMLKLAFNRERPDGHDFGFPSGHVASTFALASMLDEMYGHKVGYPMYLLGGFVAYARMSKDKHYLSDVTFGAFLGYAIGKAVFRGNEMRILGMEVEPYIDEEKSASGISLVWRF